MPTDTQNDRPIRVKTTVPIHSADSLPILIIIMGSSNEAAYYKNVPVASGKALVFIGDSTLDNITWVGRYENCIKAKAQGLLPDVKVYNFAADGFTSSEVWGGSIPSISYSMRKTVDPFPTASACSKLHPLDELKKIPEPVKFVVLSVGGNDLRTILSSPTKIASESQKFIGNYMAIVDQILKVTPNLVLMMQYRPSIIQKSYNIYQALDMLPGNIPPQAKLNAVMQKVYAPIVQKAKMCKLPMIDLPNTFDIYNEKLYVSQIEPSSVGGEIIARLIAATITVREHAFFYMKKATGEIAKYQLDGVAPWKVFID